MSVEITRRDDDSTTMCLSNSQDDDSMVSSSIEKNGISRGVVWACVRTVLKGVRASRVKGRACDAC